MLATSLTFITVPERGTVIYVYVLMFKQMELTLKRQNSFDSN